MIVSASRRTDIPAFYSDWFFNRLKQGYVYVRNPMNSKQVSKVCLSQETVDCFVFWTKDPRPIMERLPNLKAAGYAFYFQFTLTPYGADVEPGLPCKDQLAEAFKSLSEQIGPERVIWRYDPVFLNSVYTKEFHIEAFEEMSRNLEGYTNRCVISFLDMYDKIKGNMARLGNVKMSREDIDALASHFGPAAKRRHMKITACSEDGDFSKYHIEKGRCVDDELVSSLIGKPIRAKKDDAQREFCGCVKSVDIGAYNTCGHFCRYCYANQGPGLVEKGLSQHDPCSPLLTGSLRGDERITLRDMKSLADPGDSGQLRLPL